MIPPLLAQTLPAAILARFRTLASQKDWQQDAPTRVGDHLEWRETSPEGVVAVSRAILDLPHHVIRIETTVTNTRSVPRSPSLDCLNLWLEDQGEFYTALRASGGQADGHYPPENYRLQEVLIAGSLVNCSPEGGRSSDRNVPVTMVADKDGAGFWFALEWSGTWHHVLQSPFHSNATRPDTATGLRVYAAISGFAPVLAPGESLTLPPVHIGFFVHGFVEASNRLRRYLHERIIPHLDGRPMVAPTCYDHWFGIGNEYDDAFLRTQLDVAAALGLEYFVVDAGWHTGDFPHGAGNWDHVNREKFPHGLKAFADHVRAKGLKFGLWLEPEQAYRGTAWATEHPDYFLDIGEPSLLLDLSRREVQDFLIEKMDRLISEFGVQWSRWDFNINPAPYWRKADPTGRLQQNYIAGIYRVWDVLMERHPDWLIENCASGGRRLDFGSMRRSHTSWFSDETVSALVCRYMQLQANVFMPGYLCNAALTALRDYGDAWITEHDVIARMGGTLLFSGDIASLTPALRARLATQVTFYKQVRHLLSANYYRPLPTPATAKDWDAGLFVSPDQTEALLLVFRTHGPAEARIKLPPNALLPNIHYHLKTSTPSPWNDQTLPSYQLTAEGLSLLFNKIDGLAIHFTLAA